ncbi:hypothetical protein [Staphylococcus sp. GDY8P57P]|uniref:hypothetical protein n=1 Tax=Staphylococcus sp. GDY8P57P TaxID=2804128 RepID=UPI00187DDF1A|nr:hypothetical protein [Staphylococcus sp. GDY8P57P]MBF2756833.1 hypothetical protein [Staphylococcus haemolyticus]MBF2772888.1 hypothetical protein [Staphylococcus haemolyticus]MBF2775496.1 hypothetical protein [Staphylococcus haemolyticus]MBF2814797.1 hypothetical protein [Staphylococcus haemolyticus]MBF9720058.1 hypothetical protein [Staphylococcus haemolyticus]
MPKIKVKKQMNLPELLAWGMTAHNYETEEKFHNENVSVYFNDIGEPRIECKYRFIPSYETFTVEIEEEITEETAISRLLEVRNAIPSKEKGWKDLKILKSYMYGNHTIAEVKNEYTVAFYMLNDDMTMTLLWKDGAMV